MSARTYLSAAGALLVAAGGMLGGYVVLSGRSQTAFAGSAESPPPSVDVSSVLAQKVEVSAGGRTAQLTWQELGAKAEPRLALPGSREHLASRALLPLTLDRDVALKALGRLRGQIDRAPIDAFLDLENRAIQAETAGEGLDLFASLPVLESAAQGGASKVELPMVALPARVTRDSLGISDISTVIGHYTTKFSVADKERNFNLKLAASKLNGHVLQPQAEFSFNQVVGERSEKEGYKVAHVITAGEMVDGLAGGTCQISTTLFAASFFAGLDIVDQSPHSRPSVYAPMGLDATVVWPHVDLKLRNPFEFPVVIHYRVARGEATVELLGKERPYTKVAFEREVVEETPFVSEERLDEELAVGTSTLDQPGFNGYKLLRTRRMYTGRKSKADRRTLVYKPVTEYVRRGVNENPDAKIPETRDHHMPKAPTGLRAIIEQ
jgi:vancomycin resistance protein YoaR